MKNTLRRRDALMVAIFGLSLLLLASAPVAYLLGLPGAPVLALAATGALGLAWSGFCHSYQP